MPVFQYILRTDQSDTNPTLFGGVYSKYITIGRAIGWYYDGSRTRGIIFISDGGNYGLDSIDSFEYKGSLLTENTDWIFHRGKFASQILPKAVTVDNTTDTFTSNGHGYSNTNEVRFFAKEGDLPAPLEKEIYGQSKKYFVRDVTTNTFKVALTSGGTAINITNNGTGDLIVWRANKGFDDPEQGLPSFIPELKTVFNNIAYIEFKLPSGVSVSGEQPDWQDFRVFGIGRRLMEYDNGGSEIGLISGGHELLASPALQIIDNLLVNYKVKNERIDFISLNELKTEGNYLIWDRIDPNDVEPADQGFIARYYQDENFTNLVITRLEPTIDMGSAIDDQPAPGVSPNPFSAKWSGTIVAEYSETYTLKLILDNKGKLIVNGQVLIDAPSLGTHTATFTMVAGESYNVEIQLVNAAGGSPNPYEMRFKWSSASQVEEIVPASATIPSDQQVKRYESHTAFSAVEASEVHERLMERCPGWHWTDDDGTIQFLPPDRLPVFNFKFDKMDDDSVANFVNNSFQKKRRKINDRKNFLLMKYRKVDLTGYPVAYVQIDREELRRFTNGEPSNEPASDLGVTSKSLARRMGEMEMVIKSDPDHLALLDGGRDASKIRKNQLVTISYIEDDDTTITEGRYLVTLHSCGANNDRHSFSLLPIRENFYSDEPVVDEFGDAISE
jgi:hypothetical protein